MKKLFSAFLILAVMAVVTGAVVGFNFLHDKTEPVKITYTVRPGDTLTHIAEYLKKQTGDPRDIDEIVFYIKKDNGLLLDLGFFELPTRAQLERVRYIHPGQKFVITMQQKKRG